MSAAHRPTQTLQSAALACLWTVASLGLFAGDARAQARPQARASVSTIFIEAPAELRSSVRAAVAVREGTPYEVGDIQRSLQNIYALGNVSDVRVLREQTAAGTALRFVVMPAAHLHETLFVGDSPIGGGALADALTTRPGDRIDRALLAQQAENVQQALSGAGYTQAVVEPELRLSDDGIEGTVLFHLRPGTPTRLSTLSFVGDLGIDPAAAREAFGIVEESIYRSAEVSDGIDRLRRRLADDYFFHAEVAVDAQGSSASANTAFVVIRVVAGPRVELNVSGWDRSEEELREMLPFFEEASVADWILNQARNDIVDELQRQGHWKPLVSYGRRRDDEGRNVAVNFTVIPAVEASIKRIDIEGNDSIPDEAVRTVLRTRESRLLRSGVFTTRQWEQDQRAVIGLFRRAGFLEARIEDAEVTFDASLGGLRAHLLIDEGPRSVVGAFNLEIDTALGAYGIDTSGWREQLQIRAGGPFNRDLVRQDETRLRILLADEGFPRAMVGSRVDGEDPHVRDVTFSVVPGRRIRVGQVLITGNRRVRDDVIRRELSFVPGSPLTQGEIIGSQSRLYQLGLFSRVDIDTAQPYSTQAEPTVVVRVEEGASERLSWGLGYSTEEQVRGLVVVGQDNLWNRNHRATVSLRASFLEQRARFIYTDPYLLGRRLEGSAIGYFESTDEQGFKVQSYGASFQAVKQHTNTLTSIARYSFRNRRTFDVLIDENLLEPEDRDVVIGSTIYTLVSDTRPNPIDPRGGTYHTFDAEVAAKVFGSESDFVKLFGRSYWYWGLPNNSVFVVAARGGLALAYQGSSVPLPERFFAGGSTTLRGFGRNDAGPTDTDGNPLGGDVLLIGNVEYRFPVRGNVGGVVSLDVGNVFADVDAVSIEEIRESIGLGVRYDTPIGPLRLDWGYLLDARTGEDRHRFHFAIGQAF